MHFRIRKHVIQLIRITYEPGKKRGVNTVVGSVRLTDPVLSNELRNALTSVEIKEYDEWLMGQRKIDALQEELTALTLPQSLAAAQRWFEQQNDTSHAHRLALDISAQWLALRHVLLKKGLIG